MTVNVLTVAFPHGAVGWSAVVIVIFPDHTHFCHHILYLGLVARKTCLWVSDKMRFKLVCSATETS